MRQTAIPATKKCYGDATKEWEGIAVESLQQSATDADARTQRLFLLISLRRVIRCDPRRVTVGSANASRLHLFATHATEGWVSWVGGDASLKATY